MIYDYVQTKPELNDDLLMHYGVKGMKWHKHLKSRVAGYKLKTKHAKNRAIKNYVEGNKQGWLANAYAKMKKKISQYKKTRTEKLKTKQAKDWIKKGARKSYKSRKKDIKQARANAKGIHSPAGQYYTSSERRKQIKQGREKASWNYANVNINRKKNNKKKNIQRRANSKRW